MLDIKDVMIFNDTAKVVIQYEDKDVLHTRRNDRSRGKKSI